MSHDNSTGTPVSATSFAALRRFVRAESPQEHCDLCRVRLGAEHQHLFDAQRRQLLCACDACALLFDNAATTKYRRVPRRARYLPEFHLSNAQWDAMLIPVGMAFFSFNSSENRVMALYPSPVGATEPLLPLESWQEIACANPVLQGMQPDVEALLINRLGEAHDYYIVPIDKCFELVGLLRMHWRGFSGGLEVWREINQFYARLNAQAGVSRA